MQLEWRLLYYTFLRPDVGSPSSEPVFFFVRQATNLILPRYLVICVGTHFQIVVVVVFTPGCMSVCVAAELDPAKSSIQFRLNGVTVKNQKDKEQDREERNQEPSGSFI